MPNTSISDSLAEKHKFLEKYDKTKKFIELNSACYAIAADWWANFECLVQIASTEYDMPMGNPGPINNLALLDLNAVYKDLVHSKEENGNPNSVPYQVLRDMNDWDNMAMKKNLRYREDFIVVSHSLWKFLEEQFGGGPEIEFILESKPTNPGNIPENAITHIDEPYMKESAIVNLDMIKVYITKGYNFDSAMPRYISPTLTVHNLLSRLCVPGSVHTTLYLKTKPDGLVELDSNLKTLVERGVQHGSFLMYEEDLGSGNKDGNRAKVQEIASSKDREYGDFGNYNLDDDLEMKELEKGSRHNSHENNVNHIDSKAKNNAQLEVYLQKSREAAERPKIKLGFKTLDEIKANLAQIQDEWNSWTGSSEKNS